MIGQQAVVEHLVSVVQLLEVHVLGQVVRLLVQLGVGPLSLLIQREDCRGQSTNKTQSFPLILAERHTAICERIQ